METQQPLDPLYHYNMEVNSAMNDTAEETENPNCAERSSAAKMRRFRTNRGPNRPRWAANGTVEKLKFNAKGQPVAPPHTVARFSRFLGWLALEPSFFPIDNTDWRNFYKASNMDASWERIKGTIDWSNVDVVMQPFVRRVCELKLNDRWKSYKSRLRRLYYKPNIGTPRRFACSHPSVNQAQWRSLMAEWDKKPNQERALTYANNRKELRSSHTNGTKTFARMRYEYEQVNGYAPDRITFFTMTHTREDGTVVDAKSADIIAKFKNGLKEYEDRQEILTDEIRHKVYSDVLGPEKRNRVRGYGLGVQFTDVPGVVTEARGICREVHTLRAAWEQQKQATEEAHVEIKSLRLANINLAEELRHEQAVTMETHKKNMEDSFAKMKENMMNEVNKLFHNSSSTDGERGVMENQMASKDRIDEEDCVMADQENVEVYSPIMPFDLNSL